MVRSSLSLVLITAVLSACARPPTSAPAPIVAPPAPGAVDPAEVTRLADAYVAAYVEHFPESAEQNGLPIAHHDGLTDNSLRALAGWRALEDGWAPRLAAIDPHALWGRPEWTTLGFLKEAIEASREARVCESALWPVSQQGGWIDSMNETAGAQPVGTDEARKEALARFGKLPAYLQTEIENLRVGIRRGYTTPRRNVDLVIAQLDALLATSPSQWPLASPAERDPDPAFRRAWGELLSGPIARAVRVYRDFLHDEYRAHARESQAITANPDGLACYRALLRVMTSLDRTPEEVAALGRRTVDANLADALAIGREKLGVTDLAGLLRVLDAPQNHFQSRDEQLAFARASVERAAAGVKRAFSALPATEVRVEPYPVEQGASVSDGYVSPAGARAFGIYCINLLHSQSATRSDSEITAFHETFPGHHLQIAVAAGLPDAHPITRIVGTTAYVEGWARYAERLSEELGLYNLDAARIQRRLWAARGMVVDPGFHTQGWSREKAVAFIAESGRFTGRVADDLVDRIAIWPGQLTAYDTGGLEFVALRQEAERELGARFDLRAFHAVVLGHGPVTLPMLQELVHEWIRETKGNASRAPSLSTVSGPTSTK